MGIQGLLKFLRPLQRQRNISEFRGQTVGVDAMCWMHKGAYSCALELVKGIDTDRFIKYFIGQVEVLRYFDVKPVIVFDGARMPAKEKENQIRQEKRDQEKHKALTLLAEVERVEKGEKDSIMAADGVEMSMDKAKETAQKHCEGAICITGDMISRLMNALRELGIQFLVAPYEADAQLAFLCRIGWVDMVISEDSDLLAYGCPNTFFKMDKSGNGDNVSLPCLQVGWQRRSRPPEPGDAGNEEHKQEAAAKGRKKGRGKGRPKKAAASKGDAAGDDAEIVAKKATAKKVALDLSSLDTWSADTFTEFCVLCGTDYKELDVHIKGLGIQTAFKSLSKHGSASLMFADMRKDKKWLDKFPCEAVEYETRFNSVVSVFWQHIVFDPAKGNVSRICQAFPDRNRALPGVDLDSLTGQQPPKEDAVQIYKGDLDPRSKLPRPQEGLTKMERQFLLQKMRAKSAELHDYQFQMQLKEDKARHAAARAAASSQLMDVAPEERVDSGPAVQPQAPADHDSNGQEAAEERVKPSFARPLRSDLQALVDILDVPASPDDVEARNEQDNRHEHPPSLEEAARTTGATPPRISPRKRPRAAATAEMQKTSSANPFAKRSKVTSMQPLKERRSSAVTEIEQKWRERQPEEAEAVEDPPSPARKVVETEVRPLGGFAAQDASNAVLAQKRGVEYEPLEEQFDRRKIAFFMGGTKARAAPALKSGVAAALAAARADEKERPAQASQIRRPNNSAKIFMRR
mmetsp:Transcript_6117/g.10577  ORF Transcript_6117/g.10577 Transcript_6117/m.10577 type:complete len:746 (+) Transcript_6117:49-2286(+)